MLINITGSSFKLGADPEFETIENFKVKPADRVLGILDSNGNYTSEVHAEIGTDGNSNILEIRPEPASNIDSFINNSLVLLKRIASSYDNVTLSSIGEKYPLGSHIHFNIQPNPNFIGLLDTVLGIPFVNFNSPVRVKNGYTGLSSIETKEYGFEYRSVSGLWTNPEILKTVATLLFKILNKKEIKYRFGYPDEVFDAIGMDYDDFRKQLKFILNKRIRLDILANWGLRKRWYIWRDTYMPETAQLALNNWDPKIPVIVYGIKGIDSYSIAYFNSHDNLIKLEENPPESFLQVVSSECTYDKYYLLLGLSKRVRDDSVKIRSVLKEVDTVIGKIMTEEV